MLFRAVAAFAVLPWSAPLSAQDLPSAERDRVGGFVRLSGLVFDNFFQAPEGADTQTVLALGTEARLNLRPDRRGPYGLYLEVDRIGYEDFGPAGGVTAGVLREGRHMFDLSAGYHWNRPTFEVGDQLEKADALRADGRYEHRIDDDWQAGASAQWQEEKYDFTPGKENDLLGGALMLRYRGFGAAFQPEVGLGAAKRDVVDDDEDYTQRETWIRVRSRLSEGATLSVRYRYRNRDYDVTAAGSSNFQREDRRHQVSVGADRRLAKRVAANLYYAYERSDSSRVTRTFAAQLLSLGVSLLF